MKKNDWTMIGTIIGGIIACSVLDRIRKKEQERFDEEMNNTINDVTKNIVNDFTESLRKDCEKKYGKLD